MISIEFVIALLALGATIGFMAGLLGIGGGGIMVPVLSSFFLWQGFDPATVVHLALGTSMASIVVTSLSSAFAHHRRDGVRWPVVMRMTPGILVGTFASTFLVSILNNVALAIIFSVFMSLVALQMFVGATPKPERTLPGAPGLMLTGSGIGAISALVSIGGGTLSVPFLYWHNIKMAQAIGTSAALGVPIAVSGTFGYIIHGWQQQSVDYALGFIYLPAVVLISLVSVFTAPLGARMHYRLPVKTIKRVFGILLLILSVKMLASVLVG